MNSKELEKKKKETLRKFEHSSRIHRNCIRINSHDSLQHNLVVFLLGYAANRGIFIHFNENIKQKIRDFCSDIMQNSQKAINGPQEFLTQSITEDKKERFDMVMLDSGARYEVDVSHGNIRELKEKGARVITL